MLTTCASRNLVRSVARSAMSLPCHYAGDTIRFIALVTKPYGGKRPLTATSHAGRSRCRSSLSPRLYSRKKKKSTITGAQRLLRNVDGGIREAHRMQDRHKRSAHVPTVHVRIQASGMRVWSARKTRGSPLLRDSGVLVAANSRLARMPHGLTVLRPCQNVYRRTASATTEVYLLAKRGAHHACALL